MKLLRQLEQWHRKGENEKIIGVLTQIPQMELSYDMVGILARAYNNYEEYDKAILTLEAVKKLGYNDSLWLSRLGYAYFYSGLFDKALEAFERCKKLNPVEENIDLFLCMTADQRRLVNGELIPTVFSLNELSYMIDSPDMKTFVIACDCLLLNGSYKAYEIMKKYISSHDKYRQRYILSSIYKLPYSEELVEELEKAICSNDNIIVNTALRVLLETNINIKIPDKTIILALQNGCLYIHSFTYTIINQLSTTQENYMAVLNLYHINKKNNSNRIVIAESIYNVCSMKNFKEIFDLFKCDIQPKIRMVACRLAKQYGFINMLEEFLNDSDGHIRKFVKLSCIARVK